MTTATIDYTAIDTVFRTYDVVLTVDSEELEPRKVVLRYTIDEADELHPTSPEAQQEAFVRATKLERRENDVPEDRIFYLGSVKLRRHTFRPAKTS